MEQNEQALMIREVWDDEKKKMVAIKPEQVRIASMLQEKVTAGVFVTALAIKRIIDERLYLALGASSVNEYCDTMLPFSSRQAYRYKAIADRFQGILPQLSDGALEGDISSRNVTPGSQHDVNGINHLGYRKLYELTTVEDADFTEMPTKGVIRVGDQVIDIDEINALSAREFSKRLAEIKKGYSARISQLEEKNKLLESERVAIETREAEADSRLLRARDLERMYGTLNNRLESQLDDLNRIDDWLLKATSLINRQRPEEDFPDGYYERVRSILRRLEWLNESAQNAFALVIYSEKGLIG